jgi:hypothetical protein
MLQRIQTIYYLISLICIAIVSFGGTILQYHSIDNCYNLTSYGIEQFSIEEQFLKLNTTPFYLATIIMGLLLIIVIFDYKNLNRQLRIGRLVMLLYFILVILSIFGYFIGNNLTSDTVVLSKLKIGFYALIIGLTFVLLGNIGVKKDKKLLDSLNRLR